MDLQMKIMLLAVAISSIFVVSTNGLPLRHHKSKSTANVNASEVKRTDVSSENIRQTVQPTKVNSVLQDNKPTTLKEDIYPLSTRIHELYDILMDTTENLYGKEEALYEAYKTVRFNNSNIVIREPPFIGLPNQSELPLPKRRSMTEEDLLSVHRVNLMIYLGAMEQVHLDETKSNDKTNFGPDMEDVIGLMLYARSRLDAVMYELNFIDNPVPTEPILFKPTDEATRNERDLYVLQEIYDYLPMMLQDFPYLKNSHVTTPTPPSEDLYLEYDLLIEETEVLAEYTWNVYREYKIDRNGGDPCEQQVIPGLPNIMELSRVERLQMTEDQLLKIHRTNLHAYEEAMTYVIDDERLSNSPKDFTEQFETVKAMERMVISREESVMLMLGTTIDPPPTNVVVLEPTNEAGRNARDCYILQEIDTYLPMCLQDFLRLQLKHGANHHR